MMNDTTCTLSDLNVVIDLSKSAAQLVFDTTAEGAGVEVFQPFEKVQGQFELTRQVLDGDQQLTLLINDLAAGDTISFTIDVDDTLQSSELGNIRVSSSEMQGSQVFLQLADQAAVNGTFGIDNQAVVEIPSCPARVSDEG